MKSRKAPQKVYQTKVYFLNCFLKLDTLTQGGVVVGGPRSRKVGISLKGGVPDMRYFVANSSFVKVIWAKDGGSGTPWDPTIFFQKKYTPV